MTKAEAMNAVRTVQDWLENEQGGHDPDAEKALDEMVSDLQKVVYFIQRIPE